MSPGQTKHFTSYISCISWVMTFIVQMHCFDNEVYFVVTLSLYDKVCIYFVYMTPYKVTCMRYHSYYPLWNHQIISDIASSFYLFSLDFIIVSCDVYLVCRQDIWFNFSWSSLFIIVGKWQTKNVMGSSIYSIVVVCIRFKHLFPTFDMARLFSCSDCLHCEESYNAKLLF